MFEHTGPQLPTARNPCGPISPTAEVPLAVATRALRFVVTIDLRF